MPFIGRGERKPLGSGSDADFCTYTYATCISVRSLPKQGEPSLEFLHEHAHWIAQVGTSAALYLAALRHAKDTAALTYLVNNKKNLSGMAYGSGKRRRPIAHRLEDLDLDQVFSEQNDEDPLRKLWRLKIAEQYYFRQTQACQEIGLRTDSLNPLATGLLGRNHVETELLFHMTQKEAKYRGNFESDLNRFNDTDGYVSVSIGEPVDTVDLFETFAVLIELSEALQRLDFAHLKPRWPVLLDSSYSKALKWAFTFLDQVLSVANLSKQLKIFQYITEIALSPPVPPLLLSRDRFISASRFFPSNRFGLLVETYKNNPTLSVQAIVDPKGVFNFLRHSIDGDGIDQKLRLPGLQIVEKAWFGRPLPEKMKLTWYEIQYWLFLRMRQEMVKRGFYSIVDYATSNAMKDALSYNQPSILLKNGGRHAGPHFSSHLIGWIDILSSQYYAIDDVLFGTGRLRISPFPRGARDRRHQRAKEHVVEFYSNNFGLPFH